MRKYIIHVGWLFVGFFIIILIGVAQHSCSKHIEDETKVTSNVTCKMENVEQEGGSLRLNLACGNRTAYISKVDHIVQYWQTTSLLSCTLFKSGRAECTRLTN